MGRITKDETIKSHLKRGDSFISNEMKHGLKRDGTLRSRKGRWLKLKCGRCQKVFDIEYDVYRRYCKGNCNKCANKAMGEANTVNYTTIKNNVSLLGNTLITEGSDIIDKETVLTYKCPNNHHFDRKYSVYLNNNKCPTCIKLGDGVTNVKLSDLQVKKSTKSYTVKFTESELLTIRAKLKKGFTFVFNLDKKVTHTLVRCPQNHILRVKLDSIDQLVCLFDKKNKHRDNQGFTHHDAKLSINSCGDTLLSNYANDRSHLEIRCGQNPNHVFYKTYNNYYHKNTRCPFCRLGKTQEQSITNKRVLGNNFVHLLESEGCEVLTSGDEYDSNRTLFKYKCPSGHLGTTCQDDYVNGNRRCFTCAQLKKSALFRLTHQEVNELCLNAGYTLLSSSYVNMKDKVKVECLNCNHIMKTTMNSVVNSYKRCDNCCNSKSTGELLVERALSKNINVVKFKPEFSFGKKSWRDYDEGFSFYDRGPLRVDFKVELSNGEWVFIEFDGKQHFTPVDYFGGEDYFNTLRYHDLLKTSYFKFNSFSLLRISYSDIRNTESLVDEFIQKIMHNRKWKGVSYSNIVDYKDFRTQMNVFDPVSEYQKRLDPPSASRLP